MFTLNWTYQTISIQNLISVEIDANCSPYVHAVTLSIYGMWSDS